MSWYDAFIPPEVKSVPKLFKGDFEGAAEAQLGRGGTYLKKTDEGNQEIRQGYTDAIENLKRLSQDQQNFQMQGLDKAEGYFQPAQERLTSIYGPPGAFRK